ncbi:lycopene cyclase family protein [Raineya orbicola]|jgi:lycopene beta-cyclase|uniref:Lycopene cyclase protein n=1 Tax=Raineya orbicola TaxID=2016530 RepID=A0A2N3II75_9BACT|nr:lycopene cyclase family protein [Raineya orbicola]PKQ69996.1 Lycopene cyclase protein [Raineya orbicola]
MTYPYVIAGTGAAGLSLAFYLAQTSLRNQKILLIDKNLKNQNDRTWCFWQKKTSPFEEIIFRKWQKIAFFSRFLEKTLDIAPYHYKMIRGIDFYLYTQNFIQKNSDFEFLQAEIYQMQENSDEVILQTSQGEIKARYVFNGLWQLPQNFERKKGYFYWFQHFKGWFLKTQETKFEADKMYYMDFRVPQKEREVRFGYVLPFSSQEALVEFTVFSNHLLGSQEYLTELQNYTENILGLQNYEISETEFGVIPMFDEPFLSQKSQRIIPIGTRAGAAKASTGFAFDRIQRQTHFIAENLAKSGKAILPKEKPLYHLYDSALLNVIEHNRMSSERVFSILFAKHPIQRIFRFLDEESNWYEDVQIMNAMPWKPFLQAIFENWKNRS